MIYFDFILESLTQEITNPLQYSQDLYNKLQQLRKSENDLLLPLQHLMNKFDDLETSSVISLLNTLCDQLTNDMMCIGFNEQSIQIGVSSIIFEYLSTDAKSQTSFYDYSRLKLMVLERLCVVVDESLLPKVIIYSYLCLVLYVNQFIAARENSSSFFFFFSILLTYYFIDSFYSF